MNSVRIISLLAISLGSIAIGLSLYKLDLRAEKASAADANKELAQKTFQQATQILLQSDLNKLYTPSKVHVSLEITSDLASSTTDSFAYRAVPYRMGIRGLTMESDLCSEEDSTHLSEYTKRKTFVQSDFTERSMSAPSFSIVMRDDGLLITESKDMPYNTGGPTWAVQLTAEHFLEEFKIALHEKALSCGAYPETPSLSSSTPAENQHQNKKPTSNKQHEQRLSASVDTYGPRQ